MAPTRTLQSTLKLNNGIDMPIFGLGTWRSESVNVGDVVYNAIKNGYRYIDCAQVYFNEVDVGNGIKKAIDENIIKRSDLFVVSKLWVEDFIPKKVRPAIELILKDLGLDYVDQILMHWPYAIKQGLTLDDCIKCTEGTEIADLTVTRVSTYKELEKLYKEGKIKSLGVSNFCQDHIADIIANCEVVPTVNQVECHPLLLRKDLLAFMTDRNIKLVAYSPLGNVNPTLPSPMRDEVIAKIAKKYNKSPAQICLRFNIQRDIIVIPKTMSESRLIENANVFDFEISDSDMKEIETNGEKNETRHLNIFPKLLFAK